MTPKFSLIRYAALAIAPLVLGMGLSKSTAVISSSVEGSITPKSQLTASCSLPDESPKKTTNDERA